MQTPASKVTTAQDLNPQFQIRSQNSLIAGTSAPASCSESRVSSRLSEICVSGHPCYCPPCSASPKKDDDWEWKQPADVAFAMLVFPVPVVIVLTVPGTDSSGLAVMMVTIMNLLRMILLVMTTPVLTLRIVMSILLTVMTAIAS